MKILLAHRYFWPDTPPYGALLRSIAQRLTADGHQVTVFSAQPSYNRHAHIPRRPSCERLDGFDVVRLPLRPETKRDIALRIANNLAFEVGLAAYLFSKRDFDVVMAATFPPVVTAFVAQAAAQRTGARFVYHCQDIHPEVTEITDMVKRGRLSHLLRRVDTHNCMQASAVVVLCKDMANTMKQRGVPSDKLVIINNFVQDVFGGSGALPARMAKPPGKFRVLFAGNLGLVQGLDAIIDAAHRLADLPELEFVFLGDGAAKPRLIDAAGPLVDRSVFFWPYQPQAVAECVIDTADLGVVTLSPGMYQVAYPSKTMSYLKRGCPLLLVVEPESELYRMVEAKQIGFAATPGDVHSLCAAIRDAISSPERLDRFRRNALAIAASEFDREHVLQRWSDLMRGLERLPKNSGSNFPAVDRQ